MNRKLPVVLLLLIVVASVLPIAFGQPSASSSAPSWLPLAVRQALSSPLLPNILFGKPPAVLPQTTVALDINGVTATYFPGGPVTTANNAFFQSLGSNGRTCFTCHQPQNNWSISPGTIAVVYATTLGRDPLFAPIDGANCPDSGSANSKFGAKFVQARSQLFVHGNIRIGLPVPASPEWASVTVSSDPTGCEKNNTYGLPAGMLSFYRRPLPATNVIYTTPGVALGPFPPAPNIMWDTREPSLASQFVDATMVHGQTSVVPTADQVNQGVSFQSGSFTAQSYDYVAQDLTGADGSGATGGGNNLFVFSNRVPYFGPFGLFGGGCSQPVQPCPGSLFPSTTIPGDFDETRLFGAFASQSGSSAAVARRQSIARGEVLFNTRQFDITGVTGLNDLPGFGGDHIVGTCSRCHNNANVGNDAFDDPKHLGVSDNSYLDPRQSPTLSSTLPLSPDMPIFTFLCPAGSISYFSNPVVVNGITYDLFQTSDPGVGWITGKCNDLGKFKVSSLRGIGARPPFFHGGQAATMRDVILFYNVRFNMNLSEQEIEDLTNFMNAQ